MTIWGTENDPKNQVNRKSETVKLWNHTSSRWSACWIIPRAHHRSGIRYPRSQLFVHKFFTSFENGLRKHHSRGVESLESRYHKVSDHPRDSRGAESRKSSHHRVRRRPIPLQVFRHKFFLKTCESVNKCPTISINSYYFATEGMLEWRRLGDSVE